MASLLAGGALFLLLGAIPALADGGPHSITTNSGSAGINADSCAGCHRAHTATAPLLLAADESDLCLTCHGGTGSGATTDVMNGVQYKAGQTQGTGAVLGALRAGGFETARIDTANAGRLTYTRRSGSSPNYTYPTTNAAVVPVRATGQDSTSRHLNPENPVAAIAWGSGAISASDFAGSSITLECTSCHNPHGNGQYRILNPVPGDGTGAFPEATGNATVTDLLQPGRLHNYTVMQKASTTATYSNGSVTVEGAESGYLLYADQVDGVYAPTVGDYFHRQVPWNGITDYTAQAVDPTHTAPATIINRINDAPNGHPTTFNGQINSWCAQCHTRYLATSGTPYNTDSGDGIYTYRHSNTSNKPCTTCHVAHGSNAQMGGAYSSVFPYPNSTGASPNVSASSRLLKFDNRGTCSACHDPTETVPAGTWYPAAAPTPVVP
ncbi:MAG: cytochrome c3 family protein [Candidatus Limnocylindrales bacterium]